VLNIVKERLIDQVDKSVPFMLRPAFPPSELPACVRSTYLQPSGDWLVLQTPYVSALCLMPHSGFMFRLTLTIKQLSFA